MKKFIMALFAAIVLAISAAPAAHATARWGAGSPPNAGGCTLPSQPNDMISFVALVGGSTCETISDPSSTYLHQANAMAWLAHVYNAGGPCGKFKGWSQCMTGTQGYNWYDAPFNATTRIDGTEVDAYVSNTEPFYIHQYCWWAVRLIGTDANINVKPGYSIRGGCGPY